MYVNFLLRPIRYDSPINCEPNAKNVDIFVFLWVTFGINIAEILNEDSTVANIIFHFFIPEETKFFDRAYIVLI